MSEPCAVKESYERSDLLFVLWFARAGLTRWQCLPDFIQNYCRPIYRYPGNPQIGRMLLGAGTYPYSVLKAGRAKSLCQESIFNPLALRIAKHARPYKNNSQH